MKSEYTHADKFFLFSSLLLLICVTYLGYYFISELAEIDSVYWLLMIFLVILGFLLFAFLFGRGFFIVKQNHIAVVELFGGRYLEIWPAGIRFYSGFFKIRAEYFIGTCPLKIKLDDVSFIDGVTAVEVLCYIRVVDPVKVTYNIHDYWNSIIDVVDKNVRTFLEQYTIEGTNECKKNCNLNSMINQIDYCNIKDNWGVEILSADLTCVIVPSELLSSKHSILVSGNYAITTKIQADAERMKRVLEAQGAAEARKIMINIIKDYTELELLYSLQEMAKGPSNTILFQIPDIFKTIGISNKYSDLTSLLERGKKDQAIDYINNIKI